MFLAINTSTSQLGLALLEHNGSIIAEYHMSGGKGHFAALMPALEFLLSTAEAKIQNVDGLAVAIGPGSFTGLRVGLSTAKGLSHALNVPLIGVSSLEALATQAPHSDIPIIPILDSRKGEFFAARFVVNGGSLVREMNDTSLRLEELTLLEGETTLFIGNDFSRQSADIKDALGSRALLAPAFCWNLKASTVGFLGLKRFIDGKFDDPKALTPIYLRPPDIRQNQQTFKPFKPDIHYKPHGRPAL